MKLYYKSKYKPKYSSSELQHHGIKGMKWGVRRYQNEDGSLTRKGKLRYGETNARTLRKGTEVQNISRRQLDSMKTSKKSNRLYVSYTKADNAMYTEMMAGFQYENRGYKNSFVVKKDIKIASEQDAVNTMVEMFRDNPKRISQMMATAYNAVNMPLVFQRTQRGFYKKLSEVANDPTSTKAMKLGRTFTQTIPMTNKASDVADDFYGRMVKKGFDAVLDTNDGRGWAATQDPLVIFNMEKLGDVKSVKLTKRDIEAVSNYTTTKEYKKLAKDYSSVAS